MKSWWTWSLSDPSSSYFVEFDYGTTFFIIIINQKHSLLSSAKITHFSLELLFKNLHFSPGLVNIIFHYHFYSKSFISLPGWGISLFITLFIKQTLISHLGSRIPQNSQNCWIPTKPNENIDEINGFLSKWMKTSKLVKTVGKPMDSYQN